MTRSKKMFSILLSLLLFISLLTMINIKAHAVEKKTPPTSGISLKNRSFGVYSIKTPVGWSQKSISGGDYYGRTFANPHDKKEQLTIMYSSCAGCGYKFSHFTSIPDPLSLIPESNITGSFVFRKGLAAGYSYRLNGNSYPGNGIAVLNPQQGYYIVEIVLPSSQKSIATQVLNSFKFSGI